MRHVITDSAPGAAPDEQAGAPAPVAYEFTADALWLWLDRPEQANSLSPELLDALDTGLDLAEGAPEVRSVVLAARGATFCAGADLKLVQSLTSLAAEGPHSPMNAFLRRAGRTFDRFEAFPKPVIAAVHGLAVAGGLELVLCCDLVIAGRSARLGDGHANFGFIPGGGASFRLARRLGPARAKYLMFTGKSFPAEYFAGTDLVNDVVDDADLYRTVGELTALIARRSPLGLRRMKSLVADAFDVALDVGLRMELDQAALHEQTDDFREGLSAFNEKRQPTFLGR